MELATFSETSQPSKEPVSIEEISEAPDQEEATKKTPKLNKKCADFDEILEQVESQGRFQRLLLYAFLCPVVGLSPILVFNTIFLWDIPEHHCHVPGIPPGMSESSWNDMTLPWEREATGKFRHSKCRMIDQETGFISSCKHGWDYDKSNYEETIASSQNWVCDKDDYATNSFTWSQVGCVIGTVIFGLLADKYGRRRAFFVGVTTCVFFRSISLFWTDNIYIYQLLQVLGSLSFPALYTLPGLMVAEVSGTKYRTWIYTINWMIWVAGNTTLPWLAMLCRSWFLFGCITTLSGCLFFFYYPVLPESPRWLMTKGRTEEAQKVIFKIAEINGRSINTEEVGEMVDQLVEKLKNDSEINKASIWKLFSKLRIARNTIMLGIVWAMDMLLYNGITLNTTKMVGNKFLNYFLLALVELSAGVVGGILIRKTGRRWTQVGFFLVCGICCGICAVFVVYPEEELGIALQIGVVAFKFGLSITYMIAMLQCTEVFPTPLRSTGTAIATTMGSVAVILGPYVVYSSIIHPSLPYGIFVICSFIGLLSSACLPETLNQPLPETIDDANKFGKEHGFWSFLP